MAEPRFVSDAVDLSVPLCRLSPTVRIEQLWRAARTGGYGQIVRWLTDDVAVADRAARGARAGKPAVLTIIGHAGLGKTSFLSEVVERASGFAVLFGEAEESDYHEPFSLIRSLGVDDPRTVDGRPKEPIVVAQDLRERLDAMSGMRPVIVAVDDLQWADPESVEAFYWLFHRASRDRILLAAATRPNGIDRHPIWNRMLSRPGMNERVELTGLDPERARALIRELDGTATDSAADKLTVHTGGNPLYIRSLLRRHTALELAQMDTPLAPRELAESVRRELASASQDAVVVLNAIAVLGQTWSQLPLVAQLAEVEDVGSAVDALLERGLIDHRPFEPGSPVRPIHALTRAAVYQTIPSTQRREFHLRAAKLVATPLAALHHRVAATTAFDDELADELATASHHAVARGELRLGGQLAEWSSSVTTDASTRSNRHLDALFLGIASRDLAVARSAVAAAAGESLGSDPVRAALVRGALCVAEKEYPEAAAVLTASSEAAASHPDRVVRYRHAVLHLQSLLGMGARLEQLLPVCGRTERDRVHDPSVAGDDMAAAGQVALRLGDPEALRAAFSAAPGRAADAPVDLTFAVAWRASIHAWCGADVEAEADLAEVTHRMRHGMISTTTDGMYDGLLGFARWQRGAWDSASVDLARATDATLTAPHPVTLAIAPLLPAARGDLAEADAQLDALRGQLRLTPWWEVAQLYAVARVTLEHARGDAARQRRLLGQFDADFGDFVRDLRGYIGTLTLAHLVMAACWAQDVERAERALGAIYTETYSPPWVEWGRPWLRGLIAECRGNAEDALRELTASASIASNALPLYRAHSLTDLARVADRVGDTGRAASARRRAIQLYRDLGAAPFLSRLATPTQPVAVVDGGLFQVLSARERDVATLAVTGLTYAQIGRELYLSSSTVRFHLSNVYAKTGVSGRHDLTALARRTGMATTLGLA